LFADIQKIGSSPRIKVNRLKLVDLILIA